LEDDGSFCQRAKIAISFLQKFKGTATLRENADYYGEFSKDAAEEMLKNAKIFIEVVEKLLV